MESVDFPLQSLKIPVLIAVHPPQVNDLRQGFFPSHDFPVGTAEKWNFIIMPAHIFPIDRIIFRTFQTLKRFVSKAVISVPLAEIFPLPFLNFFFIILKKRCNLPSLFLPVIQKQSFSFQPFHGRFRLRDSPDITA